MSQVLEHVIAWQFWRQWLALRFLFLLRGGACVLFSLNPGGSRFFLFEPELKVQLVRRFRFGPESMPIVARQLMLQLFNLQCLRIGQFDQTLCRDTQFAGIRW